MAAPIGDALPLPGAPRELGAQHLGDVDLDADRAAVRVARRPVGAQLERADVAERAAVRATHVRVERPGERHALDPVERDLARLLAVLDAVHDGTLPNTRSSPQADLGSTGAVPILRRLVADDLPRTRRPAGRGMNLALLLLAVAALILLNAFFVAAEYAS